MNWIKDKDFIEILDNGYIVPKVMYFDEAMKLKKRAENLMFFSLAMALALAVNSLISKSSLVFYISLAGVFVAGLNALKYHTYSWFSNVIIDYSNNNDNDIEMADYLQEAIERFAKEDKVNANYVSRLKNGRVATISVIEFFDNYAEGKVKKRLT